MVMRENKSDTNFDIKALLHPAAAYAHPSEVLQDDDLTLNEKRAVLASWASDACAVEAAPELRQQGKGPLVSFDDIMEALRILDGEAHADTDYGKLVNRVRRIRDLCGRGEGGSGGIFLS
jgi:hypothetical protein